MKKKGKESVREVEYKNKAGTAWSHSYLNQKPWHPLSYPNQRRKWIAEQLHGERDRKAAEIAREFAQEQDFFRQSAMLSKQEKEKMEVMQAVSFMYMRPPGYNPESARAAEIEDEQKKVQGQTVVPTTGGTDAPQNVPPDQMQKPRVKDVYGRAVPTEEEFPLLKNAPRLETGTVARVKPFAVEVRNVKCVRCGAYGHKSGDRECPMKDAIMPSEEARLRRDDPLTTILAHTTLNEPLKWELKQQPGGMSPARGGFKPDDPNQQIIPEEIFDEYGGFLASGDGVPEILMSVTHRESTKHKKKKRKKKREHNHKHDTSDDSSSSSSTNSSERGHSRKMHRHRDKKEPKRKRSKFR